MITKRIYNSINYRFWHVIQRHFPFLWAKRLYMIEQHKTVDFSNPKDLNEKIQWLEFFTDTSLWSTLADKYSVRQYVADKMGGSEILIPLLGKWDDADDIDFDSLPDSFVMKPNNGSYDCVVVADKNKVDLNQVREKMRTALKRKFGLGNAEPHYLRIRPCIIAEKLIEPDSPQGLIDYKIWCFNGKAHSFFVCVNRNAETHHADFIAYDLNWNRRPEYMSDKFRSEAQCASPSNLIEMIATAERLSAGLPQCRVDLYSVNGRIYFGEMTFTSNYGMMPYYAQEILDEMGALCTLPVPSRRESIRCFFNRWRPYF